MIENRQNLHGVSFTVELQQTRDGLWTGCGFKRHSFKAVIKNNNYINVAQFTNGPVSQPIIYVVKPANKNMS